MRPVVLAHRGLWSAGHRQNSADAIRAANSVSDGVEIDIRSTADGVLVLSHDSVVAGVQIAGATYRDLQAALPKAETPTTFTEAIRELQPDKWLFAELKVDGIDTAVFALAAPIFGRRLRIGSFAAAHTRHVRTEQRWIIAGTRTELEGDLSHFGGVAARASLFPLPTTRTLGELAAWDLQCEAQAERLVTSYGVRFLIADEPDRLRFGA